MVTRYSRYGVAPLVAAHVAALLRLLRCRRCLRIALLRLPLILRPVLRCTARILIRVVVVITTHYHVVPTVDVYLLVDLLVVAFCSATDAPRLVFDSSYI